jgi:hypothetical protein
MDRRLVLEEANVRKASEWAMRGMQAGEWAPGPRDRQPRIAREPLRNRLTGARPSAMLRQPRTGFVREASAPVAASVTSIA